jgi:hypothetical protein
MFGGEQGLLMPYVFQCSDKEQADPIIQAAVFQAIKRLGTSTSSCLLLLPPSLPLFLFFRLIKFVANCGVHHLDVKWRHVGLYKDISEVTHV